MPPRHPLTPKPVLRRRERLPRLRRGSIECSTGQPTLCEEGAFSESLLEATGEVFFNYSDLWGKGTNLFGVKIWTELYCRGDLNLVRECVFLSLPNVRPARSGRVQTGNL